MTGKRYADGTQVTNTYENTTSRLKSITDALAQVKTFTYAKDDTLTNIAYTKTVNPTPNVSFTYDPYFRRVTSMTDGNGTRAYSYQPVGSLGALQLLKESGPYTNDFITYTYDPLSRLNARTVDTSTETFAYDKLSRLIGHGTALGAFNLSYLGQTGQITSQQISTGTVGTAWQYDTNTNDRRLKAITNSGPTRSFTYTTTPENLITQIQETAPNGSAWAPKTWNYSYDNAYRLTQASSSTGTYGYALDPTDNTTSFQSPNGNTSASYNDLNQIVNFGSYSYVYDKNGNVLDDGVRTYTWDAENRLLSIASKLNSAKRTTFRYDGLGRRTAIDTVNGMMSETRYLWCGEQLCQTRTSSDNIERRYYSEGEYLPLVGTSLYYSQDQIGSVRDVIATQNGSLVASFDYDPYGNLSQSNGRVNTDFRYAGLFYDQQDGIYLTLNRPYDAKTGKWLARDPLAESAGSNIYEYTLGDPINSTDTMGLACCGTYKDAYDRADSIADPLRQIGRLGDKLLRFPNLKAKYDFFDSVLAQSERNGGLFYSRLQTVIGQSFFKEQLIGSLRKNAVWYGLFKGGAVIGAAIETLVCPLEDSILDNSYVQRFFSWKGLDYSEPPRLIDTAPTGWSEEEYRRNVIPQQRP